MIDLLKLTAVALLAVLGLAVTSGVAFAAPETSPAGTAGNASPNADQTMENTSLTAAVIAELADAKGVESALISVQARNGVVYLSGVLPSKAEIDRAVAAAKNVRGVKRVDHSGLKTK